MNRIPAEVVLASSYDRAPKAPAGIPGHAVCAWCGRDLGARPHLGGHVTHGICTECLERELARFRRRPAAARAEATL
jgi:hypothetical protein